MAKFTFNRPSILKKTWLPHLVFWIMVLGFVAANLLVTSASAVDSSMSFEKYKSTRTLADIKISFSQPSSRTIKGGGEYQMEGLIKSNDLSEKSWDHISLFLVEKNGDFFWIAEQSESKNFGVITPTDLSNPSTKVKVTFPTTLIPPGVYYMGVELCTTEKICSYSINERKYLLVTPNSIQFVKPKNLAKIQSIGTRQRAINFLTDTFFPETK